MIYGIDVSSVQGVIDWDKVAGAGIRFAIAKCGWGNQEVNGQDADPTFMRNASGARAAGIAFGPYHFLYPLPTLEGPAYANRSPEDQAQAHWAATGGIGASRGDLPAFRDLEWPYPEDWGHWGCSKAQIPDWDARYKARYEALSGRACGLYTDEWFWTSIGGPVLNAQAAGPLWCAQPRQARPVDGDHPTPWAPFASWSVWQWTGEGATAKGTTVPGVPCGVDGDCIQDEAALSQLLSL